MPFTGEVGMDLAALARRPDGAKHQVLGGEDRGIIDLEDHRVRVQAQSVRTSVHSGAEQNDLLGPGLGAEEIVEESRPHGEKRILPPRSTFGSLEPVTTLGTCEVSSPRVSEQRIGPSRLPRPCCRNPQGGSGHAPGERNRAAHHESLRASGDVRSPPSSPL